MLINPYVPTYSVYLALIYVQMGAHTARHQVLPRHVVYLRTVHA